jgi:hypothetical protein
LNLNPMVASSFLGIDVQRFFDLEQRLDARQIARDEDKGGAEMIRQGRARRGWGDHHFVAA